MHFLTGFRKIAQKSCLAICTLLVRYLGSTVRKERRKQERGRWNRAAADKATQHPHQTHLCAEMSWKVKNSTSLALLQLEATRGEMFFSTLSRAIRSQLKYNFYSLGSKLLGPECQAVNKEVPARIYYYVLRCFS